MKRINCLLLLLLPILATAQKPTFTTFKFRVISAETGKPMQKLWYTILKDEDQYQTASASDTNGTCAFKIRNYDATATYQAEINNQYNNVTSQWFDITGMKNEIPTLKIKAGKKVTPNPCGERMYPGYHPLPIFAFAAMPENIQAKLKGYLIDRTGKSFYKCLQLNLGQKIDIDRYEAINPPAENPQYRKPPIYSLCISVMDTLTQETNYSFRVNLDKNGNLIGSIDLPDIKHNAAKAHIISQAQAITIAAKNNVNNADVRFHYDKALGSIVWQAEKQESPDSGPVPFTILRIDAHTGAVLSKKTETRTVMY